MSPSDHDPTLCVLCLSGTHFLDQPEPAKLTLEVLNDAIRRCAEESDQARIDEAGRVSRFWESLPERLHGHPFVAAMANSLNAIFHPSDAKAVQAEFDRLASLSPEELAADRAAAIEGLR